MKQSFLKELPFLLSIKLKIIEMNIFQTDLVHISVRLHVLKQTASRAKRQAGGNFTVHTELTAQTSQMLLLEREKKCMK